MRLEKKPIPRSLQCSSSSRCISASTPGGAASPVAIDSPPQSRRLITRLLGRGGDQAIGAERLELDQIGAGFGRDIDSRRASASSPLWLTPASAMISVLTDEPRARQRVPAAQSAQHPLTHANHAALADANSLAHAAVAADESAAPTRTPLLITALVATWQ